MARYVVDVMPKREILDPQGKAVLGALGRLGFGEVTEVRQGKRFEVELDGDASDERLEDVRRMAETLLANPVIEDFSIRRADSSTVEDRSSDEHPSSVEHASSAEDPSSDEHPSSVEPVETTPDQRSLGDA